MDNTEQEECSAVDVSQRIKQFQSRINKITTKAKDKSSSRDSWNNNNNNSEYDNRNIVKTRSKSLPGKSPIVRYEAEEERNISEKAAAPPTAPAGSNSSSATVQQQEEIASLPSVKMLASKFSHQSRTRRIDSKVFFKIILMAIKLLKNVKFSRI